MKKERIHLDEPYVILNPYRNSPLSALIAFSTDEEVSVTLTVPGPDEHSTFTQQFESSNTHLIPVYGLYADTLNQITLSLSDGQTKTIEIQTDPLPEDFALPTMSMLIKRNLGMNYTF